MRIQSDLAAYAQEIDSLKAVLELRNSELHDVRLRNLECNQQVTCTHSLHLIYTLVTASATAVGYLRSLVFCISRSRQLVHNVCRRESSRSVLWHPVSPSTKLYT